MSKELQIIRALYEESSDRPALEQMLENDETLRDEVQALREVKFHLDKRKRQRPEPHVIEAIVAAAASKVPAEPSLWHKDRPARRGRVNRSARFRLVGGILTALLVASIGLWHLSPLTLERPRFAQESSSAVESEQVTESLDSQHQLAPDLGPRGIADVLDQYGDQQTRTDLSWDTGNEVRVLHRRIEMLQARSGSLDWGQSVMPLESAAPRGSSGDSRWQGLQPAFQGNRY